jgi:urease accessory protein
MLRITHRVHHGQPSDTLELPFDQRTRSRHRVRLASGREAALLLERGMVLHDGDLLATEHGETVRVVSATESLSVVRTDSPESLARAAYHLGNRHVTLQIGEGFVAYPHDHVLDAMVHALGLTVSQKRAPTPNLMRTRTAAPRTPTRTTRARTRRSRACTRR